MGLFEFSNLFCDFSTRTVYKLVVVAKDRLDKFPDVIFGVEELRLLNLNKS